MANRSNYWYYENSERVNELSRIRAYKYYHNNVNYKIKTSLRVSLRKMIKGQYKSSIIKNYIGCDLEKLKKWLSITAFINGYYDFDIDNLTKNYQIDHKIPITDFDLRDPEECKKAYHWTNLQILSAKDNKIKYTNNNLTYNQVRNSLAAKVFSMMYNDKDK